MATSAERKEHPISMRLPEADIAMIDRAAGIRGRSRTDFVRDAAVRAAEDVLMENRLIRMNPEGFADFMAVLSGPADLGARNGKPREASCPLGARLRREKLSLGSLGSRTADCGARRFRIFLRKPNSRRLALRCERSFQPGKWFDRDSGSPMKLAGLWAIMVSAPTAVVPTVLPRSIRTGQPADPVPCLLLAQLATDLGWAGRGSGQAWLSTLSNAAYRRQHSFGDGR